MKMIILVRFMEYCRNYGVEPTFKLLKDYNRIFKDMKDERDIATL